MDLNKFVDGFSTMTCVVSVERTETGYGAVNICAGNRKFLGLLDMLYQKGVSIADGDHFVPGTPYYKYLSRNMNFEDFCYRSAVLKKPIHTYINVESGSQWFNVFSMPIDHEDGNTCYCTYSFEKTDIADIDLMSSSSAQISSDVLKTCIKLRDTRDFRKTLSEIIADIRVMCGAAVCTIMLIDQSVGKYDVIATSISDDCDLKRATQFKNFYDIAFSWIETIGENDCILIKNESDMQYIKKINEPWYLTLTEAGVESVVMFPLRQENKTFGFIWATNFDTCNTLRIKETLGLTTFFVSSDIASYIMMNSLKYLSFTDMLTGISNNNALNSRIKELKSGSDKPFGVAFADLNGLKRVNDENGHLAGDLLLKKAAILLQETFPEDEVYRAGGDEFIVISFREREEFERRTALLKKRASDPDSVCFAVGRCYSEDGGDINEMLLKVDEDMYRDKDQYYTEHPERKHR